MGKASIVIPKIRHCLRRARSMTSSFETLDIWLAVGLVRGNRVWGKKVAWEPDCESSWQSLSGFSPHRLLLVGLFQSQRRPVWWPSKSFCAYGTMRGVHPHPAPMLGFGGEGRVLTMKQTRCTGCPTAKLTEALSVLCHLWAPILLWSMSVTLSWRSSQPAAREAMATTLFNGAAVESWARPQ